MFTVDSTDAPHEYEFRSSNAAHARFKVRFGTSGRPFVRFVKSPIWRILDGWEWSPRCLRELADAIESVEKMPIVRLDDDVYLP